MSQPTIPNKIYSANERNKNLGVFALAKWLTVEQLQCRHEAQELEKLKVWYWEKW